MSDVDIINVTILRARDLANDFQEKYKQNPKYIKMPLLVYNYLKTFDNVTVNPVKNKKLLGMTICTTVSITEIDEMEVF